MIPAKIRRTSGSASPCLFGSLMSLASCIPLAAVQGAPAGSAKNPDDFMSLSLEELGSIKVTSVSKKSENLNQVSAAASVITAEDIRRSGVITVAEALRLVPGVQVARVDATQTAVSVRGFNDAFSQKLLVLVDGRSVYSPVFAGVFWQGQNSMVEDLDRIEVIRGPGGTVWGANAVNGVINVVSKSARETQGLLLFGGGGSEHNALGGIRYGVQLGENTFLRVFGRYDDSNNSELVTGGDANDAWTKGVGGFRLDWEPNPADRLTFQGDVTDLRADEDVPLFSLPRAFVPPPPGGYVSVQSGLWEQTEGNLLGRWTHEFSEESDFTLQTYYVRGYVDMALLGETRDTFDVDLRHRFQWGSRNEFVWGGGYRVAGISVAQTPMAAVKHPERTDETLNLFVQDEIKIVPDHLKLTLGSKVEHNDYTGFEAEPNARLSWTPTDRQTVWASVARAVRIPSLFEHDVAARIMVLPARAPFPPSVVSVVGSPDFRSETLVAFELGYRFQPHERLTFDAATFLNEYDRLRSTRTVVDPSHLPDYLALNNVLENGAGGRTYGAELGLSFQAADWWRWHGTFSVLEADLRGPVNLVDAPSISAPEIQSSLRSSMDLGTQVQFDAWLRHAGGFLVNRRTIPSYVTFDLRLAWRPTPDLEFALVGQNLAGSHREFSPTYGPAFATEVSRSVYGKLTLRF